MNITAENNQIVLTPSEGFVLCKPDKTGITTLAYLAVHDSPENYIEIPTAEAEAIAAAERARAEG